MRILFLRLVSIFSTLFFLVGAGLVGLFTFFEQYHPIDFSVLEQYQLVKPTILLDNQGDEWARFWRDRRDPIEYRDIPQSVIQAFIAAEDWQFFNHIGISVKGIIRSIVVNLYHGKKVQGASTITQQLVKLLFLDSHKTFARKIKEQVYALLIERQYTKEQILQTYLNNVYFGAGIYGIEAASQRFWSKPAIDLTVDQAAVLAGIVQCPNNYCPLFYPLSCQKRRDLVLLKMHTVGFISAHEKDLYVARPVELLVKDTLVGYKASHFKEAVRQYLEEQFGKDAVYGGGLIVQTTMNQVVQKEAEQAFFKHCQKMRTELQMPVDGALITLDNKSAGIRAMVGGCDFSTSQFNRALQARRQMGSIIKPLVYAAALLKGISVSDTEIDEPIELAYDAVSWKPRNYDKKFHGIMTRALALSRSNNIVTIKTLLKTGIGPVVKLANDMGIDQYISPYPSLALGCIDVTLKEAAGLFSVFARAGVYEKPYFIEWVKDRWGKKIAKKEISQKQVLPVRISDQVAALLMIGVARIKKKYPQGWISSQMFSKTGTTNESRTCWFAGSTPSYTTVIYTGCDDNRSMGDDVYPIRAAFPIWFALHSALKDPVSAFTYHYSLQEIWVDGITGQPASASDVGAVRLLV